jgi:hypothetical protein
MLTTCSDYNFELDNHDQCLLVNGLQPISAAQFCGENPDAVEYYPASGYRRIPLTTCDGGEQLDKQFEPQPCPGHEDEFERKHRVSGVVIFFAVIIPICVAAAAGWWVWRNWSSQFGQIRLGDQSSFDNEAPWIKYPIVVVSAVGAVVVALPSIAASVWRYSSSLLDRVRGGSGGSYSWLGTSGPRRFTTRDSFARGRGDYAIVDDVEGELLGEDSDEEV